jgi:hypothetical protein
MIAGVVFIIVGIILVILAVIHPVRLPGDIVIRRNSTIIVFPLATSIVVSVILTLLLNILLRK